MKKGDKQAKKLDASQIRGRSNHQKASLRSARLKKIHLKNQKSTLVNNLHRNKHLSLSSQPPQKKMLKIKDLIYLNPITINRSHLRLKTLQIFASISLNASWSSGTVSQERFKQKVITQANDYRRVKGYTLKVQN